MVYSHGSAPKAVAVYTRGIEPGRLRPQQMPVVHVKCQEPEVWAQGNAYDFNKVSTTEVPFTSPGGVIHSDGFCHRFGLETPGSTAS